MSPTSQRRRGPQQQQHQHQQLNDQHRTTDSSLSARSVQSPGFMVSKGCNMEFTMDSARSLTRICRTGGRKHSVETGVGRIRSKTTHGGRLMSVVECRQRGGRSAGTVTRLMVQLLLVAAVLSSETHAHTLHAGREHRPRENDTEPDQQQQQRPTPFSVDTYDEAIVSHVLSVICTQN